MKYMPILYISISLSLNEEWENIYFVVFCYRIGNSSLYPMFIWNSELNLSIWLQVHQDMTAPLSHFFIFTGHNSYLTGNQLTSDCSDVPVIKALQKGVRVIELDIWPNSSKDDVHVLHGRYELCCNFWRLILVDWHKGMESRPLYYHRISLSHVLELRIQYSLSLQLFKILYRAWNLVWAWQSLCRN